MERVWNAQQTQQADRETIASGIPSLTLMETAARAVVSVLEEEAFDRSRPLILAGTGNNGGDGVAIARLLAEQGLRPCVLAIGDPEHYSKERRIQEERLPDTVEILRDPEKVLWSEYTVVIDALFGIGLHRPLQEPYETLFRAIRMQDLPVVAVDMPSGVDTDSGAVLGCALPATCTVTFSTYKPGQLLYPGKELAGEVFVREIGIRDAGDGTSPQLFRIEAEDRCCLPPRRADGHKGTFGKALVIAGSWQICGAAYLSAMAALRSGIGMVKIYTEERNRAPLAAAFPEALLETYSESGWDASPLQDALDWADAVLIGPGIGVGSTAEQILQYVLEHAARPLVLDADALNLLARDPEQLIAYEGSLTLTPHMQEMSRLTGKSVAVCKADPVAEACALATRLHATVVLKDAATVVAEPEQTVYLYDGGSSALATAGSGDVLAGLITGLITRFRGEDLPLAALAVAIHGACGCVMEERRSAATVLAGDLFEAFPLFL